MGKLKSDLWGYRGWDGICGAAYGSGVLTGLIIIIIIIIGKKLCDISLMSGKGTYIIEKNWNWAVNHF